MIALSFNAIKRTFDKISSRLFLRDFYDPQILNTEITGLLASTIDMRELLDGVFSLLDRDMKLDYSVAIISNGSLKESVIVQKGLTSSLKVSPSSLVQIFEHQEGAVIVDFIDESRGERISHYVRELKDSNVAAICELTDPNNPAARSGFLVFGNKRSGDPLNSTDVRTLKIITSELAVALQNSLRYEEIKLFNKTLQHEIEVATKELKRTNSKLKALDEAKDEFISMASHQLRTPLTSIKGYISMVLEGDAGEISQDQRRFLDQAFASSQRMVFLISDLLNVSRIQTGKFKLEKGRVDISKIVEDEVAQLAPAAEARHVTFHFERPDDFPVANLDETKIRQVIMNMLDNALYYTPAGGNVYASVESNSKEVIFKARDTGIGVPKEEQAHLFTKFYRADNAKEARPDGTGIGLFMAKKVVDTHKGSIIFESKEGKGSTFGFKVPI